MKIIVEGDFAPCARPRFSSGGRPYEKVRTYQPARNRQCQERISWAARQAMKSLEPLTCEICADVKIYRRYKRSSRRFGDVDNLAKNILDALTGIIFKDDAQVVRCLIEKFTDKEHPRAEIEIYPLEARASPLKTGK